MIENQDIIELIGVAAIEVNTEDLQVDVDLYGQGLDSLDMASLELRIEERYGIDITTEQALRLRTVSDFVNFLNANVSNAEYGT